MQMESDGYVLIVCVTRWASAVVCNGGVRLVTNEYDASMAAVILIVPF